jgi:hypothetical protein
LLAQERDVTITFTGVVTGQTADRLVISGVTVDISSKTQFNGDPLSIGSAVVVTGHTRPRQGVSADAIQTLPPGSLVPTGEPVLVVDTAQDSGSHENSRTFHLEGMIDAVQGQEWSIQGRKVYVTNVHIPAGVGVGSNVEIEGYFSTDGRFIATQIELEDEQSGADSGRDGSGEEDGDEDENEAEIEDGSGGIEGEGSEEEAENHSGGGSSAEDDSGDEPKDVQDSGDDHSGEADGEEDHRESSGD